MSPSTINDIGRLADVAFAAAFKGVISPRSASQLYAVGFRIRSEESRDDFKGLLVESDLVGDNAYPVDDESIDCNLRE